MPRFFTRERFSGPQFVAGIILLAFVVQCGWFAARVPLRDREVAFVLRAQHPTPETSLYDQSSPITGLIAAAPLRGSAIRTVRHPVGLMRLPFIIIGVLLGASIWYVARRLYGNPGGYIALILYAFSPWFVIHSAMVEPEVIAAWAAFGVIFTSIGVAHSLYAPREVVLWNWKRIVLLGLALGVGFAAYAPVIVLLPVALGFMWYLVPERRGAAAVILLAACAIGTLVVWAAYGFRFASVLHGISSSHVFQVTPRAYTAAITWSWLVGFFVRQQPAVTAILVASLVIFVAWKRTRFFGTAAPLLVCGLLLAIGIGLPTQGALPFYLILLPFAFVFIAGVLTDVLESRYAPVTLGVVLGVLAGHILIGVSWLLQM